MATVPAHAALTFEAVSWILELDRRKQCEASGHVPVEEHSGAPVTEFVVCCRCGKILGRLP